MTRSISTSFEVAMDGVGIWCLYVLEVFSRPSILATNTGKEVLMSLRKVVSGVQIIEKLDHLPN